MIAENEIGFEVERVECDESDFELNIKPIFTSVNVSVQDKLYLLNVWT